MFPRLSRWKLAFFWVLLHLLIALLALVLLALVHLALVLLVGGFLGSFACTAPG